jgi:23S rRNA (guanosine2251-2'-O)-methyltransferase
MRSRGKATKARVLSTGGGPTLIYGWHSAVAALRNPRRRIQKILATRNAAERLAALGFADVSEPVDAKVIERLAGPSAVHQGIAVLVDPLPERNIDELGGANLLVVLDQVTDPHNVGAILRSAAAFGCDALVLVERHSPTESGVLAKAASGGLEHVALIRVTNLARALDQVGRFGFERVGLDSEHAAPLSGPLPAGRIALVLGAEGKGLRRLTRERCDRLARLDVPGPIKSLNVSNAAALALFIVSQGRAADVAGGGTPSDPGLAQQSSRPSDQARG